MTYRKPDPADLHMNIIGTVTRLRISGKHGEFENLFPTDFTSPMGEFAASTATSTQARRIRVYPSKDQRRILKLWFGAARWCYNHGFELVFCRDVLIGVEIPFNGSTLVHEGSATDQCPSFGCQ